MPFLKVFYLNIQYFELVHHSKQKCNIEFYLTEAAKRMPECRFHQLVIAFDDFLNAGEHSISRCGRDFC